MIPYCEDTGPRVRSDMAAQLEKPFELLAINPVRDGVLVSSPVIDGNKLFRRNRPERLCICKNRAVNSGRTGNRA